MKKVLEFLFAVIIGTPLLIIGLISNIFFWKKGKIFVTIYKTIKEVIMLFLDFLQQIAVYIDRLGNVILANLFEVVFVQNKFYKKTLFGKENITISAAFGHAYEWIYLNKFGVHFVYFLDFALGKDHCGQAYKWYLIKEKFNNDNLTGIS